MNEIIVGSIWKASAAMAVDWKNFSAAQLLAGIQGTAAFTPFEHYAAFRQEAIDAGADATELAKLYRNAAFFDEFQDVLKSGDIQRLNAARSDFGDIEDYGDMAGATKVAANNALAARELTWLQVVAAEMGEATPETVTAADVETALAGVGFAWDGNAWVQT